MNRLALLLLLLSLPGVRAGAEVDMRGVVAHNDLVYLFPAREGWEGVPLGNGTLGAQAWQPEGLVFQLNTPLSGVYGGAICRVRVRTATALMAGVKDYKQRLSLYDATLRTEINTDAGKVSAESYIPATEDALVVNLDDARGGGGGAWADLETWRPSAAHTVGDGVLVMTDALKCEREPDYRFAVAMGAVGGNAAAEADPNGKASHLRLSGGKFSLLVAFAGTRDPKVDVAAQARARLEGLRGRGVEALHRDHAAWWADFWSKSFLKLTSADGVADYVANCWYMHIYAMGAGSRGEVPPKFNGGLWTDNRDEREWGASYWHWNTQETYWPLYAANHLELLKPYYDMYWGMLPAVEKMTKDWYGVDNAAQYQETIPFNGNISPGVPVRGIHPRLPVPKDVAATNQIYSSSAEIAMQYWWHYLYTGDENFLRERTYPLMKAVANFFLAYLQQDAQGVYFMYPSSGHETFHNKLNATTDLAALRWLFPTLIRASEILGVDADLRPVDLRQVWQEHLDHLAPYGQDPTTQAITPYYLKPDEKLAARENAENPELFPIGVFPLITLGSPDLALGIRTFQQRANVDVYGWTTDSICAARLGLGDNPPGSFPPGQMGLADLLKTHIEYYQDHPDGLQDYYGRVPAIHPYLEGSGTFSTGVNEMLVQAWNGALRVGAALPKAWNADFKLLAPGGFVVSGHAEKGQVGELAILSQRGAALALANPWGAAATISADGKTVLSSADAVLKIPTQAGKTYQVTRAGAAWQELTVTAAENDAPKHLSPGSKRWLGKPLSPIQNWQPPAEANAPQPPVVPAQLDRPANPAITAVRFAAAPKMDGTLDDPVWKTARSLGSWFLLSKRTPATQQTDVHVGYDDKNLYLGMVCWEARMAGQIAELEPRPENRDRDVVADDSVEIFLVPAGQTSMWHFAANVLGCRYDARGASAATEDARVNPEWTVATSRRGNRWIVEAAIPFSSLTAEGPYAGETWGVNFCRNEKPSGETSTWAPLSQFAFHLPAEFGRLTFADMPPAPPAAAVAPDLVGRWDFARLQGQWVPDSSGHGHAGFLTSPMKTVPGKLGQALELTGAGYVDIATAPELNLTDGMTLAVWINPHTKGSMRLIDKGPAGGSSAYLLDTNPANNLRVITNLNAMSNPVELPEKQWSHVAVTYDGQALRLYLNGQLLQEVKATGKLSATDLPLRLGADSTGASRFVGLMEDARVYRRALSAEELAGVMAGK